MNYAPKIPLDKAGTPMDTLPAPIKAKATYAATTIVSSVISFTDNTTMIEVGAIGGGGIAIRWVPVTETAAVSPFGSVIASGAGANFDHIVPPGTYRRFVIPVETAGAPQSVVGDNKRLGLYQRVAWVNTTALSSSVLGTEF